MTSPVNVGEILAGKYRIERILGVGGMGVVVAATHLDLQEVRAIKFMLPSYLGHAQAVERFLREARAASRLRSEHVAKVHDVGRFDNGAPYMVMEYLEGADLSAYLKHRGPLPISETALYAMQACEALAEAHGAGIVHRDLKPANLFLTTRRDGSACVKVLDFGISKVLSAGGGDLEMTNTAMTLGSPTYMSPEQMRSARNVDARTDIWSLGVILFRLATGHLPFKADNATELIALVLTSSAPAPSQMSAGIPPEFDAVVLRCLERDLSRRYASVQELARDLQRFLAYTPQMGGDPRKGAAFAPTTDQPSSPSGASVSFPTASLVTLQQAPQQSAAPSSFPALPSSTNGTGGSWGNTAGGAPEPARSGRPILVAALIGGFVAVAGLAVFVSMQSGKRHPDAASGATAAPPAASAPIAAAPPVPVPAAPTAAPAPIASASPSSEAPEPEAAAIESSAPAAIPPVATQAPATAAKTSSTPKVTKAAAPSADDPFGRARK